MSYLIDFIVGFLRGGLAIVIITLVLFIIANVAFADDTIATREAELGEQDRSLNYKYTDSDGVEFEHTITVVVEKAEEDVRTCEETNKLLKVSRDYAEKHIKANPKHEYIYAEVLELIEEKWCHDNDN